MHWLALGREEEGFYYGVNLQGTKLLMLCARLGGKNKPISGLYREEISIPDVVLAGTTAQVLLPSLSVPSFAYM